MNGVHVVANFKDCLFDFSKENTLLDECKKIITNSGLTIVGDVQHCFDPQGVTFTILLAESHVSIHTWPEIKAVAFDIYTCNFFNDNTSKTLQVYNDVINLFQPQSITSQTLERESLKTSS